MHKQQQQEQYPSYSTGEAQRLRTNCGDARNFVSTRRP